MDLSLAKPATQMPQHRTVPTQAGQSLGSHIPAGGQMEFVAAEKAFKLGHFNEALHGYAAASEKGHRVATRKMAGMYALGKGTQKSYGMAAFIVHPLADLGDGEAQSFLGALYMAGGFGLPRSDADAFEWFLRSAINGYADGQYMAGLMYLYGRGGGIPNLYKAQYWFTQAARQGNKRALAMLRRIQLAELEADAQNQAPAAEPDPPTASEPTPVEESPPVEEPLAE